MWSIIIPVTLSVLGNSGGRVSGAVALHPDAIDPGTATVQYFVNGQPLGGPRYVFDDVPWYTTEYSDGPAELTVVERDASGNQIGAGTAAPVTIDNGLGSIAYLGPDRASLAGTVAFRYNATVTNGPVYLAAAYVDGELFSWQYYGGTQTLPLDTTLLTNGRHLLTIAVWDTPSAAAPHNNLPAVAFQTPVYVDNAAGTLRHVRPLLREVVLAPGEHRLVNLVGEQVDGSVVTALPFHPTVSVLANPRPLTETGAQTPVLPPISAGLVSASADYTDTVDISASAPCVGVVQIGADGDPGRRPPAAVRVVVLADTDATIPHLARDGGVLRAYDGARSYWLRNIFQVDTEHLRLNDPTRALRQRMRLANVDSLDVAFAPAMDYGQGSTTTPSYATWQTAFDTLRNNAIAIATESDGRPPFALELIGDSITRLSYNLQESVAATSPAEDDTDLLATYTWGPDAIRYAVAQWAGHASNAEMTDEANAIWGNFPLDLHTGEAPHTALWCSECERAVTRTLTPGLAPVPADAIASLVTNIRTAPLPAGAHRPVISWPCLGHNDGTITANWMGPDVSDYADNYVAPTDLTARGAFAWGLGLSQWRLEFERVDDERALMLAPDWPMLQVVGMAGPNYVKLVSGSRYHPGQDRLLGAGSSPELITAEVLFAAARGAAGVRTYYFDREATTHERALATIGSELQTGSEPGLTDEAVGSDRWAALGAAFTLVKEVEGLLLAPRTDAVDLGGPRVSTYGGLPAFALNAVATGARRFGNNYLFVAVNFHDAPAAIHPSFAQYTAGGARPFAFYRVRGGTLSTQLGEAGQAPLTMAPGEAMVWLFVDPAMGIGEHNGAQLLEPQPDATVAASGPVRLRAHSRPGATLRYDVDGTTVASDLAPDAPFDWVPDPATRHGVWHTISVTASAPGRLNSIARTAIYLP